MVILRSLRSIFSNTNTIARTCLTPTTTTTTATSTAIFFPFCPLHNALFRFPSHHSGPLFLASPLWKLSQSATALYLHPNAVVFRKVNAINLNLLRVTTTPSPLHHRVDSNSNHSPQHSLLHTFLNAPNLISFARMIVNDMYTSAMVGLAISGGTDWLDGYVARKMKIDSVVGSYLDPLADKVNTVFQLGLVAAALLQPEFGTPETQSYITYLSWLVASTTVASTAAYGVQYMRSAVVLKSA